MLLEWSMVDPARQPDRQAGVISHIIHTKPSLPWGCSRMGFYCASHGRRVAAPAGGGGGSQGHRERTTASRKSRKRSLIRWSSVFVVSTTTITTPAMLLPNLLLLSVATITMNVCYHYLKTITTINISPLTAKTIDTTTYKNINYKCHWDRSATRMHSSRTHQVDTNSFLIP